MSANSNAPGTAVVTGGSGQDGYYLTRLLLSEGWTVHVTCCEQAEMAVPSSEQYSDGRLRVHVIDLLEPQQLFRLIAEVQPDEVYNLAGQSSVARSFLEPRYTYQTNTEFVLGLLECIRLHSSRTRLYQASSTDMFGPPQDSDISHNEGSALNPQSPYASAKAAAHLLCGSYRQAYGLRIACGILSNHESHRRPAHFLTRKIVDHVRAIRGLSARKLGEWRPLLMGNLKIRRDWGFAPDFVEGIRAILRQVSLRAEIRNADPEPDEGAYYRNYVLGTGRTHAVWELVDRAFALAGLALEWNLSGDDLLKWNARLKSTGSSMVLVDPLLLRPADPPIISVDASSARRELGWSPRQEVDTFLRDMLNAET